MDILRMFNFGYVSIESNNEHGRQMFLTMLTH